MHTVIQIFWHASLSVVHRQVAVASFLAGAQARGAAVVYDPADAAAADIQAAARAIHWTISPRPPGPEVPARAGPWVWIGSHDGPSGAVCAQIGASTAPPVAVFCVGPVVMGQAAVGSWPAGHQAFVTGQSWTAPPSDAPGREGRA